jgi:hypothetical protein
LLIVRAKSPDRWRKTGRKLSLVAVSATEISAGITGS